jgi:hypothetical protein
MEALGSAGRSIRSWQADGTGCTVHKMLLLTDREEISRGLAESLDYQKIGLRLGRDVSVI